MSGTASRAHPAAAAASAASAADGGSPRLRVERLAVSIDGTPVLHDIGFSVEPGQVTAVVGASGSGKTMTGLALLDLLPPGGRVVGGVAELDGRPIDLGTAMPAGSPKTSSGAPSPAPAPAPPPTLGRRALRGREIAMIFQQPRASLHPLRSIGSQLDEVIVRHAERRAARRDRRASAVALLETAGFARAAERLGARPHELSGGECQRVMIALALAGRPRVLFADEPTTALDVLVQGRLLERLRRLARDTGMGVVLVTHDLRVVAEVADTAVVVDAGRTVEFAACDRLFDAPGHDATRRLLAASGLPVPPPGSPAVAASGSWPRVMTRRPG